MIFPIRLLFELVFGGFKESNEFKIYLLYILLYIGNKGFLSANAN